MLLRLLAVKERMLHQNKVMMAWQRVQQALRSNDPTSRYHNVPPLLKAER